MYAGQGNEKETMAALALTEADYGPDGDVLAIWPDVWAAFKVFKALGTQWRVGFSGPSGLEYQAIPFVLRMQAIPRSDWPAIFDDIGVMESAALKEIRGDESEELEEG